MSFGIRGVTSDVPHPDDTYIPLKHQCGSFQILPTPLKTAFSNEDFLRVPQKVEWDSEDPPPPSKALGDL